MVVFVWMAIVAALYIPLGLFYDMVKSFCGGKRAVCRRRHS